MPFITAIERFANDGGMITEQLWEADDLPDGQMIRGKPTGAAMPLCWSHAEYIELVRSYHDGVCFDRVEPAFRRYVLQPLPIRREVWGFRHQLRSMPSGKTLRIETNFLLSRAPFGFSSVFMTVDKFVVC